MSTKKKTSEILREELADFGQITTILGPHTEFVGIMEFENSIQIQGQFEGEIITKGLVVIDDTAQVRADIKAGIVYIAGSVVGHVTATDKVNILSGGKLVGNIKTAKLKIADGVIFDGNCEMVKLEKSA